MEGIVFIGGATIQCLRDGIQIITGAAESSVLAESVSDSGGVYIVPAFTSLGEPHWDTYARGLVIGITCGTNRAHIARAALEPIAFQIRDVLEAMKIDSGQRAPRLRVDGGVTASNLSLFNILFY